MTASVHLRSRGDGGQTLLLLHGLGATGAVWSGVDAHLARDWPGRVLIADLPGHGRSANLPGYSFDGLAAAVAAALPPVSRLVVVGHSLGGVVALALASGRFGIQPAAAAGIGVKLAWTDEELARARALSLKPNPVFATRAEAAERHLKLAGLVGLLTPDQVDDGALVPLDPGWSVAFDPAAFAVGAPDGPGLIAAARCPTRLAAGECDPMCPPDALRAADADGRVLAGLGHNAQVEHPAAVAALIADLIGAPA